METISVETYNGSITMGLQKGYTDDLISKKDFIGYLQDYQKSRASISQVFLSASVTECDIVLNDQVEPHLRLDFINYPKFPLSYSVFKQEIIDCVAYMMEKMEQNRIVIVFNDETIMLENSEQVDPRVLKV